MRKLLMVIGLPFLLVVGVTVGVIWWDRGAPPGFAPTVHDVTIAEISRDNRGVRISGTAHYEARVQQRTADGDTWVLFPLFPKGDTLGREAHVLVRSTREVDSLYSFEDRTIVGMARPPGRLVPRAAREAFTDRGYMLTDDFVLIEEWDQPEEAAEPPR